MLLGLACDGGADTQTVDNTGSVDIAEIERAVQKGPETVAQLIVSQPTPERRIAAMNDAIQVASNQATAICPHLAQSGLKSDCEKRASRHHLWVKPEQDKGTVEAGGVGPASSELIPADSTVSRYTDVTPTSGNCAPGDSTCLHPAALEAAKDGDVALIAGLCAGVSSQRGREECIFASAELMVGQEWNLRYSEASELCLSAGTYAARCLAHLVNARTIDASRHDRGPVDWDEFRTSGRVIADTWDDRDPELSAATQGRFWAGATKSAVDGAESLDGSVARALPEHIVHVRAALAWRMVVHAQGRGRDLQGWTNAVMGVLTTADPRAGEVYESTPSEALGTTHPVDLWPASVPVSEGMVAANYLGTSRRLVATEPVIDVMICVLEAAVRVGGPGGEALLREGLRHHDARIRWTVDRAWSAKVERDNPGAGSGSIDPTKSPSAPLERTLKEGNMGRLGKSGKARNTGGR